MGRIMNIDDLYRFFVEQNKSVNFSSKNSGDPIVVSVHGSFEALNNDIPGMLKLKLKVCHTELNRNGSFISKENMEKAMPSLKYRPVLAYIHTTKDGIEDFYAHNMEIIEDEDGKEKIKYLEKQVGCFTDDNPFFEYDDTMDKTYVVAYAVIPEEYTSAANIIRRKNGTKVSCELVINELSYNAKEKYLDLTDFYFGGTTLLGCDDEGNEIGEGMLGARADIDDFCHKEPIFTYQDKLIEVLDKLNITLSNFNINQSTEEGGKNEMTKFNELLEKYGFTKEEIDFNHEGMTDEELEQAFEDYSCRKKKCSEEDDIASGSEDGDDPKIKETEACGKKKRCEEESDDSIEDEFGCKKKKCEEETPEEEPEVKENNTCGKKRKKCSVDENGDMTVEFSISHEEIHNALYSLLMEIEETDNDYYYIRSVYDTNFIYEGWMSGKLYRQSYTKDGDNISLGDRTGVFEIIVTAEERDALEKLKSDYSALVEFKQNIENAELKAKKDEVFTKKSYEKLAGNEAFEELKKNAAKFSLDEIVNKAKIIYADFMENAEIPMEEKKTPNVIGVRFAQETDSKDPYGGLWTDFKQRNK